MELPEANVWNILISIPKILISLHWDIKLSALPQCQGCGRSSFVFWTLFLSHLYICWLQNQEVTSTVRKWEELLETRQTIGRCGSGSSITVMCLLIPVGQENDEKASFVLVLNIKVEIKSVCNLCPFYLIIMWSVFFIDSSPCQTLASYR